MRKEVITTVFVIPIDMFPHTPSKGFTLIELLVVIGIIGILSSIVLVSVNDARKKARDTKRLQEVRQIMNALELYHADNGKYPSNNNSWQKSQVPGEWTPLQTSLSKYLPKLPTDPINTTVTSNHPAAAGDNFVYAYYSNSDSTSYCPAGKCYWIVFKLEKTFNPSEQSDGVKPCNRWTSGGFIPTEPNYVVDYNPEDATVPITEDRTVTWGVSCR